MPGDKLVVLICGGGNGAHVLSGLAASTPGAEARVMTLYADEAERWSKSMETSDFIVSVTNSDGSVKDMKAKPVMVTKDPAKAVPGADIIFFTVPAFAHEQYFTAISPYVSPNTVLVGLPGQAGFEQQCVYMLKEKAKKCAIVSFESLPWACRILEFFKHVLIQGKKETLGGAVIMADCKPIAPPMELVQRILGDKPVVSEIGNYLVINLLAKSVVHPPIMYGKWSKWDGKPFDSKPLFYQGVDELQARLLSGVADEIVATAKAIEKQRPGTDMSKVNHVVEWYRINYADQITDKSSLMMCLKTNKAYDGLVHPMREVDGKFMPDFKYRYMMEDVPFGIVVMKGIAEIAGVPTPNMDEVMHWCQKQIGKEFIVGTKLTGKDLNDSRAPQRFGYKTMDDLFSI